MRKSVGLKKKAVEVKGSDGKENDERGDSN